MTQLDPNNLPSEINVQEAKDLHGRDDTLFIDVREQHEYDQGHIPGITLIPMSEIQGREAEIPKDKTVILTCRSGGRSGKVQTYLQQYFQHTNVINMAGGILAWAAAKYPVED